MKKVCWNLLVMNSKSSLDTLKNNFIIIVDHAGTPMPPQGHEVDDG